MWGKHIPPLNSGIYPRYASCAFELPMFISKGDREYHSIDIVLNTTYECFVSTMWIFNRGICLVSAYDNIKDLDQCIESLCS